MIAIISDSHIPKRAEKIPEEFHEKLEKADTVVHCGDFETEEEHEKLREKYDIVGVKGNCDFFDAPVSETFEKNGVKFGVYHGAGIQPRGHHPTLAETAEKLGAKVLFHGHTHDKEIAEHDRKILLNPGTCTGVGGGSSSERKPSMMTVETSDEELEVVIWEKDRENGEIKTESRETLQL